MNIINNNDNTKDEPITFEFELLDTGLFKNTLDKDVIKLLDKWGITPNMELVKYRYNINLDMVDLDKFLKDFLSHVNVRASIPCLQNIIFPESNKLKRVENIKYKKLACKETNTDMFDILYEANIVNKENGKKEIK
jgi:hypothetical protein